MIRFSEEQISALHYLLNSLTITGIENAKKIVMINNILEQGDTRDDFSKKQGASDTE